MQKKETVFSNRLNGELFEPVYYEKTNNPYRRGTPDFYYEGPGGILWSEHKWIDKPWKRPRKAEKICSSESWPDQKRWLERAHNNNIQTCVIVGVGSGRGARAYFLEFPYAFCPSSHNLLSFNEVRTIIKGKIL